MASYGYDGTVSESIWAARLSQSLGSRHGVFTPGELVASGVAGVRALDVSAGWAYGWGVVDDLAAATFNANANATGSTRYDTVVVRRNWSTNTSSLVLVQGGSSAAIASGLNNSPGTLADQPLWIIPVSSGATSLVGITPIDVRAYAPRTAVATTQPHDPGTTPMVWIHPGTGDVRYWSGSAWTSLTDPTWSIPTLAGPPVYNNTIEYRVVGGMLYLRGQGDYQSPPGTSAPFPTGSGTKVATLPAAARPSAVRYAPCRFLSGTSNGYIEVKTNGEIEVRASASSSTVSFDGVAVSL